MTEDTDITLKAGKINSDLTICTVSYESLDYLKLNVELVRTMNSNTSYRYLVVENSERDSLKRVHPGIGDIEIIQGPPHRKKVHGSASYHHGEGLNLGLSNIKTRFLLVLDPDFYIILHNWIYKVISYMQNEDIGILGVPWHPYRYRKWRYFPAMHCTFFDLSVVPPNILDFRPDYETYPPMEKNFSAVRKKLKRFDPLKMHRRKYIGCSADTGFRIYKRCYKDPGIKTVCFTPVYKPSVRARLRDLLFPDRISLLPKQTGYYSTACFADYGLPDFQGLGCEEFLWNNEPFGFHIRAFPKNKHKRHDSIKAIFYEIEKFMANSHK